MGQQEQNDTHQDGAADTTTKESPWNGQCWLITGAAGDLGSALAHFLAARGATLVLLDKNKRGLDALADQLEASGADAPYLFPLDLGGASPEDYHRFAEVLGEHLGHLDGIIHAAAHFDGLTPVTQVPALQWWVSLQANLSAPLLMSRELLPLMKERGGHLVFLLDDVELTSQAYWGAYGVAQAGLQSLVQQLAAELSNLPIQTRGLVLPPFRSGFRAKAYPAEDPESLTAPEHIAEQICNLLQDQSNTNTINKIAA
ncbi:MAG: SDR family NAD(P)-dependent oxidoreductase [Xanthomonadales bacterium]|jgi:NAD(P)-dependent dehydrogenase (short-subunit alcohol dehydrogenase family)|nr:SDR family NAD(P)-dependent oxidoreductase [Xanthomonadales bacterium]